MTMKRKPPNGKPVPHTWKKVTQHDRGRTDDEPTESDSSESEHEDRYVRSQRGFVKVKVKLKKLVRRLKAEAHQKAPLK